MSTRKPSRPVATLRNSAEAQLARAPLPDRPADSTQELLHELQINQVELELQNETLRQAQAALEEARDRYIDLYDFAPVGYLGIDDTGRIAEVNLTTASMLGEDRSKLIGRRFEQFVASAHRTQWQECFLNAQRHGGRHACELALRRSDGTLLDVRMDGLRHTDTGAAPTLRIALTDIAGRKQLESDLHNSLHYQRALLDNFPFLVWLKDQDGRYLAVNRPFVESSGHASMDKIVGKTDFELWPRDLAKAYRADDQAILSYGKPRIIEELAEFNGTRTWVETYKSPVTVDGRVIGTVGFATDITERKQAMVELQASEERLRLAKRAADLGIFDRDIASGKYHWDERSREFWGVGPDEPISFATFMAGVHPDDRAATQAAIDRAVDPHGDGGYHSEYRVVNRRDGSVREIVADGQVYFENGRAVRILGTLKDISAQKQLEKEVQERRSEMEMLVRQQVAAHTAAAIAHELNQPLVSISAYSEAALRMLRGGTKSPEKLARALEGAMEQAQRAGRTLHELLDFLHKGEAGVAPIDLNKVVMEALAIAMESGYGGFRPVMVLDPELPMVQANRLQVQKVLVNLLHNSVESMRLAAMPPDATTVTVQTVADRNMALVTVRDSGPGFDPDAAKRIFEPFFTTKPQGIGLGLAISRALVEAHGGRLWGDAEMGPGATFHFTLPFAA